MHVAGEGSHHRNHLKKNSTLVPGVCRLGKWKCARVPDLGEWQREHVAAHLCRLNFKNDELICCQRWITKFCTKGLGR